MKIDKNRYYLQAHKPCMDAFHTYQVGDVVKTGKGTPRSFKTIERAINFKMNHLGPNYPATAHSGDVL